MHVRKSSIVLAVVGVILIAAAAVLHFALVPGLEKMPSSLNTTAKETGTGDFLNPVAIRRGDTAHTFLRNAPVTSTVHVYVAGTHGNTAVVHSDLTVVGPNTISSDHAYAVDRTTMLSAPAPTGTRVDNHDGLVAGLPFGPKTDASYRYWDFTTARSYPMTYTGTRKVSGRDVLDYTIPIAGRVVDRSILTTLPPALPKPVIEKLAAGRPGSEINPADPGFAALPAVVPLQYLNNTTMKFGYDKQLGAPITASIDEAYTAAITLDGKTVPVVPVLTVKAASTPQSIANSAHQVSKASTLLLVANVIVPIVLLVLGLVLIVVAVLRRRPRQQSGPVPSPEQTPVAG